MKAAARGVSMIEALVALAVAAAGLLGALGMQLALHRGAELARHRGTALQALQSSLEAWRTALAHDPLASGPLERADPAQPSEPGASESGLELLGSSTDEDGLRTVRVQARWTDRAGEAHRLQLATAMAGLPGELSAALQRAAGPAVRQPMGRHPAIPRSAVDQGNGTSVFAPPAPAGPSHPLRWLLAHGQGAVVAVCTGPSCTAAQAWLLSGHVRVAQEPVASPLRPPDTLQVTVRLVAPEARTLECPTEPTPQGLSYHCLLPATPAGWSGRTQLAGLPLASAIDDARAEVWRVCRYTPLRGAHPEVDGYRFTNRMHPLDYHAVTESLNHQNYLVIRAGDGARPAPCPPDDPATPHVNDNTWHHQPSG